MKHKSIVANVAKIIFTVCAVVAIFAVLSITIYMFLKGCLLYTSGIFHDMKSYFCQDKYGQIAPVYSISAGLD